MSNVRELLRLVTRTVPGPGRRSGPGVCDLIGASLWSLCVPLATGQDVPRPFYGLSPGDRSRVEARYPEFKNP